ncbi:MAG TPA: DUF4012 domain-containing protein [Acidimicrobiia bacterium]|nr:DUF4012 domain-containing protein [Acidimicrobiia bacterium]
MSVVMGDHDPYEPPSWYRWARFALIGLGGVAFVWAVVATVLLVQAKRDIDAGIARLEEARDELSPGDLVRGKGRAALAEAEEKFEAAEDRAGSPFLAPIGFVPLVGEQVRSVDAQTEAAAEVVAIGRRAMRDAERAFEETPEAGPARLALMEEVVGITARAQDRLQDVDLGPDFFLIGPVGEARLDFAERLRELQASLADSQKAAAGFAEFLRGPRRYLVLAANNAEMRAGSGMWLSAGTLSVQDGTFELSEMLPTGDLLLPPGTVPVEGEFAERWGWFAPTEDFRRLATTPRFDVTAPLAVEMWRALTGEAVDGVLVVDPVTLRGLVRAVGPIEAGGVALDADNILQYIFLEQYRLAPLGDADQTARRDQLGAVARAAIDAFEAREWEPPTLVDELAPAGGGRHVLAWSANPVEQEGWEAAGIAGKLDEDSLLVSLMNIGGNKLDQFMTIDGSIAVDTAGPDTEITVRLEIVNEAPIGEPAYVTGPHPRSGLDEGVYLGILAIDIPGAAFAMHLEGGAELVADGPDGPARVVATTVQLARGETRELTLRFRLPEGAAGLRVEPSARQPEITWRSGDDEWVDDHAERVEW